MESNWKKVVVGFEGSDESQDALRLGRELASVAGADLHVAVVLPRGRIPFEAAIAGGQLSEQLDERLFEGATRLLEGIEFTPARLDGGLSGRSAARALYEYAREEDLDLIVVGSSHRGKLGRILPGSVGESLLRGAPCAVAVAPRGFAGREHAGFHRIGIGYDGSEEADLALKEAERLSRSMGAHLRLITVVPTQTPFLMQVGLAGELLEDIGDEFRRVQERGLSQLGQKTKSEAVFMEGNPAAVLAEQAIELDLLVMGSRSYGPVRSALLGAISSAVMRTASCPVLITPRGLAHTPETEQRRASHELAVEQ